MYVDTNTKEDIKRYCRTLLAGKGQLTQAIYEKIIAGDETTIRKILDDQKKEIINAANQISNQYDKDLTLTQADSVQEVLDQLSEILNA